MAIKVVVSDMDGCLADLKEIHYEALNKALASIDKKYVISPKEHVKTFDGLSTRKKLNLLSELKNFPLDQVEAVNDLKQKYTLELIEQFTNINWNIPKIIKQLKQEEYKFYIASNAVRATIDLVVQKLGILHLVDGILSNQDVKNSKPHPEIYLRSMITAEAAPHETLIIEDSKHGRDAAVKSGAFVCGLDNSFDFTLERIHEAIKTAQAPKIKWAGKADVVVLVPMAGAGSRFVQAGYQLPKPLIDVAGKPMIQRVIDNLNIDAQYVFVVQKEHYEKYNLGAYLELMTPGCKVIQTDGLTEGAACTTLLAKEYINNDKHLLIANSDQFVDWDSCEFLYTMINANADGGILTFEANDPKWSYVKTNELGYANEVAEKKVISNEATVGIYYFKRGSQYVKLAEQMINKNIRVNNEFYVCPVYNELFLEPNNKVKIFRANQMHGWGTPADLELYLKNHEN